MSVYVDGLVVWGGDDAPACFRHRASCHMYADTLDELHRMADRIGMRRAWFQNKPDLPHYDLTASRRALAVREGAVEHDRYQMVAFMKQARAEAVKRALARRAELAAGKTEVER